MYEDCRMGAVEPVIEAKSIIRTRYTQFEIRHFKCTLFSIIDCFDTAKSSSSTKVTSSGRQVYVQLQVLRQVYLSLTARALVLVPIPTLAGNDTVKQHCQESRRKYSCKLILNSEQCQILWISVWFNQYLVGNHSIRIRVEIKHVCK